MEIFGISKATANELDYLYHDTTEEVGLKIEEVHNRLIAEGSPILARSWWGTVTSFGLRGLAVGVSRLWTRLKAILGKYLRHILWLATVSFLSGNSAVRPVWWWLVALAFAVLAVVVTFVIPGWVNVWVRKSIESLLAIDTDVAGLHDYFLKLNPYFNYVFRLENCYFLVLDTGHDCLTAQSFWDDGGKKIYRLRVRDNILGGSPDTMGFYLPTKTIRIARSLGLSACSPAFNRSTIKTPAPYVSVACLSGSMHRPRTCRIVTDTKPTSD